MKRLLLITAGALLILNACKKKETVVLPATKLQVHLSHKVGDAPLVLESLMYQNSQGEIYSISRLNYFLSDICFYKGQQRVFTIDTVAYIDAEREGYTFTATDIPAFSYDSISYFIGVPPADNEHGKLKATPENIAMEWPEMMGGGYHFLKLEGHWKDTGSVAGYTMHLGTNPYLVKGGLKTSGQVTANRDNTIALCMDINEWFHSPYSYSIRTDGVYTMGNAILMQRISENGRDVIKVTQ